MMVRTVLANRADSSTCPALAARDDLEGLIDWTGGLAGKENSW
ncbi:hypothetical protein [Limnohabitans sp. WS1]|nr:hypothetical protein [Limnohabitans sp. WS1]